MKKKNERPVRSVFNGEDVTDVASATECTGLMYSPAKDDFEWDSYEDLHGMMTPKE